jgi:predicted kinase
MLTENAAAVLAGIPGKGDLPADDVLAEIIAHAPNLGERLLDRVHPDGAGPWPDLVSPGELAVRADAEAARAGSLRTGCEHLVLGLYALTRESELGRVRTAVAEMAADRAHAQHLALRPREQQSTTPVVVLFAGLPGAGKSTLAEAFGAELRAPVFSLDWLLGALTPFGLVRADNAGPLGDHLVRAHLARQLHLGLDVVVDTVALDAPGRARLRAVAAALGAVLVEVECGCPDEAVHRSRVESRSRGIPGWPATVTWAHVQRLRARADPWPEPHLTLDTTTPLATCLADLRATVRAARAQT